MWLDIKDNTYIHCVNKYVNNPTSLQMARISVIDEKLVKHLVVSLPGKTCTCVPCLLLFFKIFTSHQTGSGHAADSKLCYTIQFSILVLCAKYQEAGLCGSREKCDRNYLVSKFDYVHNIQSRVKQEVDMPQIQNFVTRYSSPYWCYVPNIRKLACAVPEKNVTEIILWANLPMSTIFKVA